MNIAPISTPHVTASEPQAMATAPATVGDVDPADVSYGVPVEISLSNPSLERIYGAENVYDPRGVQLDNSPRGVEIDRIEMVKQGFEHMRELIEKISETAGQELGAEPVLLDIKV